MILRTRYISLNEAQPGMVLARKLVTSDRGWLEESLPAGQVLNELMLDKLRRGHTEALCIEEEDARSEEERAIQQTAQAQRLSQLFSHADPDHAPTMALREALLEHRLAHGADGLIRSPAAGAAAGSAAAIVWRGSPPPQAVTPAEVVARMGQLPAFPAVVRAVLRALDDDDSHLRILTRHLQQDPVISARVLSLANRPLHLRGSELVRDVFTAVNLLGLERIRELVLTDSLIGLACQAGASGFFWQHSLAVALAAEELATVLRIDRDQTLVTGLMHDLGALWLRCCRPDDLAVLGARPRRSGGQREALEREWFGIDHAGIGQIMADHWGLPAEMGEAIGQHHSPSGTDCPPLVVATHLAEMICNGLDLPVREDNEVDTLAEVAVAAIGADWADWLPDLLGRVQARFLFERDLLSPAGTAPAALAG